MHNKRRVLYNSEQTTNLMELSSDVRNVRLDGGSSPMQLSPYNLKRMTLYAAFMQQNRTRFSNAFGTRIK